MIEGLNIFVERKERHCLETQSLSLKKWTSLRGRERFSRDEKHPNKLCYEDLLATSLEIIPFRKLILGKLMILDTFTRKIRLREHLALLFKILPSLRLLSTFLFFIHKLRKIFFINFKNMIFYISFVSKIIIKNKWNFVSWNKIRTTNKWTKSSNFIDRMVVRKWRDSMDHYKDENGKYIEKDTLKYNDRYSP